MTHFTAAAAALATSLVAALGLAGDVPAAGQSIAVEARGVATEFFRSQNERRYDDTCRVVSRGFIESHALRDQRTCAAVLRVVFVWNGQIVFRIGRVSQEGSRVVVRAVADGAPGRMVLVREGGLLRILELDGD